MKQVNFEEALSRLEEITQALESGDTSLDDSLKLFEEGIKLSRMCEKKLLSAEKKLEILNSTDIPDDEEIQEDTTVSESTDEDDLPDEDSGDSGFLF
jgi:exodeoxyribonuclease VII small subunit